MGSARTGLSLLGRWTNHGGAEATNDIEPRFQVWLWAATGPLVRGRAKALGFRSSLWGDPMHLFLDVCVEDLNGNRM